MKYTNYEDAFKAGVFDKTYWIVRFGLSRWNKAGEKFYGNIYKYDRVRQNGKYLIYLIIDNEKEALDCANELREIILKHVAGKSIDYRNFGKSLNSPYTSDYLYTKSSSDTDLVRYYDSRFIEVSSFNYMVSVCCIKED